MVGTNSHRICTEEAADHVPCKTKSRKYNLGNVIKLSNVCVVFLMFLTLFTYFNQAMIFS